VPKIHLEPSWHDPFSSFSELRKTRKKDFKIKTEKERKMVFLLRQQNEE